MMISRQFVIAEKARGNNVDDEAVHGGVSFRQWKLGMLLSDIESMLIVLRRPVD
jgi:hypothetical protein